ncbi:DUF397 domain-containing protein [Streptomyces sp. DH37]|uniref:DUF397 domain-containing protein n=1 Tax=Streptomyces sp. DH37 TaxID=3040122 RepID=UPI0024428F27|nr:DUF397 domain-containing protein [Streptomyces sp. DH37]MDG9705169.1 DUF397 domain-containing protein [Streptomyces sp. DH37]
MSIEQTPCATAEPGWFKSSYSGNEGGNCVEVATGPGAVHVRDSKDREGGTLAFAPAAWNAFTGLAAEAAVTE